jgi:hypothetical protein
LDNNQVLNREAINNDPMLLMVLVIGMVRAHDESEHKSERVSTMETLYKFPLQSVDL